MSRTIKDILTDLTEAERVILTDIIQLERERLAQKTSRDMDDLIVKALETHIK